jgi:hypothetical protein
MRRMFGDDPAFGQVPPLHLPVPHLPAGVPRVRQMAATVRRVHAATVRRGFRPGSDADGHGTPASFRARVILAALCPARDALAAWAEGLASLGDETSLKALEASELAGKAACPALTVADSLLPTLPPPGAFRPQIEKFPSGTPQAGARGQRKERVSALP